MKIGLIDITKAYIGNKQLTEQNAYVGTYKVVDGGSPEPTGWEGLKITSLEDANDITINIAGLTRTNTKIYALYTSLDKGQYWTTEFDERLNKTITYTLNAGDTLCVKADANRWSYSTSATAGSSIKSTKNVNISGNIMSLLYNDDFSDKIVFKSSGDTYIFSNLFSGCKVVDASELVLPATTLANYCYYYMFNGCSNLTKAPKLPATTLANLCYLYMFYGCSNLTNAPELPATTLANYCYAYMFSYCTSLTQAPELPATTLASYCYLYMFLLCSNLTNAPELPATTLADMCYAYMFSYCTSLTQAPELPATTLADGCYASMFTLCKSLTTAPELPATTLAVNCYNSMFSYCSKLNKVTTYITSWNTSYTSSWLSFAASRGTIYNLGNADIPTGTTSGCPTGWTMKMFKDDEVIIWIDDAEVHLDPNMSLADQGYEGPLWDGPDEIDVYQLAGYYNGAWLTSYNPAGDESGRGYGVCPECGWYLWQDGTCDNPDCANFGGANTGSCPECGDDMRDGVCIGCGYTEDPDYSGPF